MKKGMKKVMKKAVEKGRDAAIIGFSFLLLTPEGIVKHTDTQSLIQKTEIKNLKTDALPALPHTHSETPGNPISYMRAQIVVATTTQSSP